jgi:hypothetical protein
VSSSDDAHESTCETYEAGHSLDRQSLEGPVMFQPVAVQSAIWMQPSISLGELLKKLLPYWHSSPVAWHADP